MIDQKEAEEPKIAQGKTIPRQEDEDLRLLSAALGARAEFRAVEEPSIINHLNKSKDKENVRQYRDEEELSQQQRFS